MTSDITIARYLMALLLVLVAIPVLVQSLTANLGKPGVTPPSHKEASMASSTGAAEVRRNVAHEQAASSNDEDRDVQEPHRVRRIDLREWRRMHDERRGGLRRS